jgi:hypothetical protein
MRRLLTVLGLVLVAHGPAFGDAAEKAAILGLRLTTESDRLTDCQTIGRVSDDEIEDLRKKIVRSGGNAALITFDQYDLDKVHAEVYRCPERK